MNEEDVPEELRDEFREDKELLRLMWWSARIGGLVLLIYSLITMLWGLL